jgi:hypothetical protein
MADIEMEEIRNEDFVQEAKLRIPIDNPEEVKKAFEIVNAVRKRALAHVEVDEDNADYTAVDYLTVENGVAIVTVAQVSV